jgi:2-keto-4-pentenoate hydratase/2-oxohepta-3-ene-1,7-dioic acid hydratase in catechol pathway
MRAVEDRGGRIELQEPPGHAGGPEETGILLQDGFLTAGELREDLVPEGAGNVHYEGEMVLVIGRKTKDVSVADVPGCVFGVTCGNDVSERSWQKSDLQWSRAKSSDTFGCVGPCIAVGLNYGELLLQTRLNGEVKQSARTSDLLYDVPTMVSFISRVMTLLPGDLVYTGTPGQTSAMKSGDVVEVELEGVGILRNTVA